MNATLTAPQTQRITLYCREGSSDKVYQAAIEPQGELFVVNFAFGRRDSTLQTGTKTPTPVDYETAKKAYDKLVREKMAKGYTEGPDGTPYAATDKAGQVSGIFPQLLNPVDEATCERLLQDSQFCMQEKFDRPRLLIRKRGQEVVGINRKGLIVALPGPLKEAASLLRFKSAVTGHVGESFIIDGEAIGDVFYAFDLLGAQSEMLTAPYELRYRALANLLNQSPGNRGVIRLVDTAWDMPQKRDLLHSLKDRKAEGVVFKRLDAAYTPGRPNSGGSQLKYKFYATLSAVVASVNDKRSVELRLLNGNAWMPCGNVTIPLNFQVPEAGQVVEVRYLHAFKESNALYQPVYLGPRQDVAPQECVPAQLKYKGSADEDGR